MARAPKIIPISDLRQNASDVVKGVSTSKEPVFITQRGRAAAPISPSYTEFERNFLPVLAPDDDFVLAGRLFPLESRGGAGFWVRKASSKAGRYRAAFRTGMTTDASRVTLADSAIEVTPSPSPCFHGGRTRCGVAGP